MLSLLTLFVVLLALFQRSKHRRSAALFVAVPVAVVHVIDSLGVVPDEYYYLMVAGAEALSITLLSKSTLMDRLTMSLIDVCALFFVAQIVGYIMYELLFTHAAYNYACLALYFVLMAVLIKKDRAIDGTYSSSSGYSSGLWGAIRPSRLLVSIRKEEV